jgi:hypothetical protein
MQMLYLELFTQCVILNGDQKQVSMFSTSPVMLLVWGDEYNQYSVFEGEFKSD